MSTLAIDTSRKSLLVYIDDGENELISFLPDSEMKHSELLLPTIDKILDNMHLEIHRIDCFAVVLGPGSFTGIRIGISTVKAFAYSLNRRVLGITTFELLRGDRKDKVLTVVDAGHDSYYIQGFNNGKSILNPSFVGKEEVVKLSKEYKVLSFESIEGLDVEIIDEQENLPISIEEHYEEMSNNLECLVPLYVRKSQAEENLEKK